LRPDVRSQIAPRKIEVRLCALAGDVCIRKRRRERPHKLPDSVVKERPDHCRAGAASITINSGGSITRSEGLVISTREPARERAIIRGLPAPSTDELRSVGHPAHSWS